MPLQPFTIRFAETILTLFEAFEIPSVTKYLTVSSTPSFLLELLVFFRKSDISSYGDSSSCQILISAFGSVRSSALSLSNAGQTHIGSLSMGNSQANVRSDLLHVTPVKYFIDVPPVNSIISRLFFDIRLRARSTL